MFLESVVVCCVLASFIWVGYRFKGFGGIYLTVVRRPTIVVVTRNLYFGRRLTPREARKSTREYKWHSVLDVAAEFGEAKALCELPGYRSLPLMDAMAPTTAQLEVAVGWISQAVTQGPVYVHCAFGHGRSACVVIGYLLSIGEVQTIDEGVLRLRALRSGVRLTREQQEVLRPLER